MLLGGLPLSSYSDLNSSSPDGAPHFQGRLALHPLCTENYHPQAERPCWHRTKAFLGDPGSAAPALSPDGAFTKGAAEPGAAP